MYSYSSVARQDTPTISGQVLQTLMTWLSRNTSSEGITHVPELTTAIGTTTGLVRSSNEDRGVAVRFRSPNHPDHSYTAFIVCDGIGGMKEGARCAELAVAHFISGLIRSTGSIQNRAFDALSRANAQIYQNYKGSGGSTLTAVITDKSRQIAAVHVGDSRIYSIERLAQGMRLHQVSRDDTLEVRLRELTDLPLSDLGHISTPEALAQFVGMGPNMRPQVLGPMPPDRLRYVLISTDGIHGPIEPRLAELVAHAPGERELTQRLLVLSRWLGGRDNATVVVCKDVTEAMSTLSLSQPALEIWDGFGKLDIPIVQHEIREDSVAASVNESLPQKPKGRVAHFKRESWQRGPSGNNRSANVPSSKKSSNKKKSSKRSPARESRQPQLDITIVPGKKNSDED